MDAAQTHITRQLQTLDGVGEEIAGALYRAGYRTPTQVRLAPDAELLRIPGIGEETLKRLRTRHDQPVQRKVGRREVTWNPQIGGPVLAFSGEPKSGEPKAQGLKAGESEIADAAATRPTAPARNAPTATTPAATAPAASMHNANVHNTTTSPDKS